MLVFTLLFVAAVLPIGNDTASGAGGDLLSNLNPGDIVVDTGGWPFKTGNDYTGDILSVDPVRWIVVSHNLDGTTLLISEKLVARHVFDGDSTAWQTSAIRAWLRDSFSSHLSNEFKRATKLVTNNDGLDNDTMFLLSLNEFADIDDYRVAILNDNPPSSDADNMYFLRTSVNAESVWGVNWLGNSNNMLARTNQGVRPAVRLLSNTIVVFRAGVYVVERAAVPAPEFVWVNDAWENQGFGDQVVVSGEPKTFGVEAFATIQDGVGAVREGGTVHVLPGEYADGLEMSKSVTLLGAMAGVPAGPDANPTGRGSNESVIQTLILIGGSDVTIDGFTFDVGGDTAIDAEMADGQVTIRNNIFMGTVNEDGNSALFLKPAEVNTTYTIEHNHITGFYYGLELDRNFQDSRFNYNYIADCENGILSHEGLIQGAHGFIGNTIEKNVNGIYLTYGGHAIHENTIKDNLSGIRLDVDEVDASWNWWGSPHEPVDKIEPGDGAVIIYSPWALDDEFCRFGARHLIDPQFNFDDEVVLYDENYITIDLAGATHIEEDTTLTFVLENGMRLELPVEMLLSEVAVEITIKRLADGPEVPNGLSLAGDVFEFILVDADFNDDTGPMTLTLFFDSDQVTNEENLVIYWYNEDAEAWERVGGLLDPEFNSVSVDIHHWSDFALMEEGAVDPIELPKTGTTIMWLLPLGMVLLLAGIFGSKKRLTA